MREKLLLWLENQNLSQNAMVRSVAEYLGVDVSTTLPSYVLLCVVLHPPANLSYQPQATYFPRYRSFRHKIILFQNQLDLTIPSPSPHHPLTKFPSFQRSPKGNPSHHPPPPTPLTSTHLTSLHSPTLPPMSPPIHPPSSAS